MHTWDQHWPDNFLVLPEGWKRDNWFHDGCGYLFLDQVGDKSWEINHACHFLGPVIPLLYYKPRPSHDICSHFLCKVGGFFLLYDGDMGNDGIYRVLDPTLGLHEIVQRMKENGPFLRGIRNITVSCVSTNGQVVYEVRCAEALYRWERLALGKDRWREFESRGGEVDPTWFEIDKEPEMYIEID